MRFVWMWGIFVLWVVDCVCFGVLFCVWYGGVNDLFLILVGNVVFVCGDCFVEIFWEIVWFVLMLMKVCLIFLFDIWFVWIGCWCLVVMWWWFRVLLLGCLVKW